MQDRNNFFFKLELYNEFAVTTMLQTDFFRLGQLLLLRYLKYHIGNITHLLKLICVVV